MSPRVVVTLVAAAFGPYLAASAGIRTEQVVVYAVACAATLSLIAGGTVHRDSIRLVGLWGAVVAVSVTSGVYAPPGAGDNMLGGLDALLLPLGAMLIAARWATRGAGHLLRPLQAATVTFAALNGVLAVAMTSLPTVLLPVLRDHWWTARSDMSVGELAAQLGRYGGVFNQPLEAGLAYSTALVLLVYLNRSGAWGTTKTLVGAGLIITGGLLSLSKVFMIAGAPMAAALFVYASPGIRRVRALTVAAGATIVAAIVMVQTDWWEDHGSRIILRLLRQDQQGESLLAVLTAGRAGPDSDVAGLFNRIVEVAPWAGFGPAATPGALDHTVVEVMARAGFFGLLFFALWVGAVCHRWVRIRDDRLRWATAGSLLIVGVLAGFGGPVLSVNRAGVLFTLNLLALLMVFSPSRPPESSHRGARPSNRPVAAVRDRHPALLPSAPDGPRSTDPT